MKKQHRKSLGGRRDDIREGFIRHHGRFAFLLAESEGASDVFLHGRSLNRAMDGDRVSARVRRDDDGRFSGEILEVLNHAHPTIVGVLRQFPRGWTLVSEKSDGPTAQVVGFSPKIVPRDGVLAVLEVTRWPTETLGTEGIIIELLGSPNDVNVRITTLLRARGISEHFPKDVLAQSDAMPGKLDPSQWHGREELFHLSIITIDGADAKDFDDAVSIEQLDGDKTRLGVHIADVAHYVKSGSALDKEAYSRGTSVYLPDRVVPMLPPSLSNNLCSLVPDEERLTVSVFMDISAEGKVTRRRMANTVIRSCRRFTYEEVQTLLDGGKVHSVPAAVADAVACMGELADVLSRHRVKRGSLDFDLPEYKVETDAHGKPLRVSLRPRLKSHRLIEEFMLLANESIATELMAAKMPFLHRRHDDPDPEKMKVLARALGDLGLSAGHITGGHTHKALQDVLVQAQSHPLADLINSLIVRSMKQAVYSPESTGHFGIAAKAYAHFTSPIRRYPDLMAHRAVKALLNGKKENHGSLSLAEAGVHCSQRERAAVEAEYKAVDIMRAELLKGQIGVVMDGVVTSVIESGTFVRLGDSGAEGMVRVTNLKFGQQVKVVVETVDTIDGKISLSLAAKSSIPTQWRVIPHKSAKRRKR
ncbi:MAG: VacB/RNase II family 3'-5' exoribonuclease [Endomicrobiales bacterium]